MSEIIDLNSDTIGRRYPDEGDFVVRSCVTKAEKEAVSNCYSLKLVTGGSETYRFGGQRWRLDQGSFLLLKPGTRFAAVVDDVRSAEGLCIYFSAGTIQRAANALVTSSATLIDAMQPDRETTPPWEEVVNNLKPGPLQRSLHALTREVDESLRNKNAEISDCHLVSVVEEMLFENVSIRQRIDRLPALKIAVRTELYRRLQRAVMLMHCDYPLPLTLAHLASEAALSVFHFSRLFRQAYGCSPCRYLLQIRIEKASQYLLTSNMPVGETALRCGFSDHTSFCRIFRQVTGLSPMAFRNSKK